MSDGGEAVGEGCCGEGEEGGGVREEEGVAAVDVGDGLCISRPFCVSSSSQ